MLIYHFEHFVQKIGEKNKNHLILMMIVLFYYYCSLKKIGIIR